MYCGKVVDYHGVTRLPVVLIEGTVLAEMAKNKLLDVRKLLEVRVDRHSDQIYIQTWSAGHRMPSNDGVDDSCFRSPKCKLGQVVFGCVRQAIKSCSRIGDLCGTIRSGTDDVHYGYCTGIPEIMTI